jgi:glycerophosphoryl diester phosphodiesterase
VIPLDSADSTVAELGFVRPVLSARNRTELAALRRRLRADDIGTTYGVSVHRSLLDKGVGAMLRDHVPVVMTWPIDDLPSLDRVVGLGANGVITNEPEILREVRRRDG